jgi:hypothetical protein
MYKEIVMRKFVVFSCIAILVVSGLTCLLVGCEALGLTFENASKVEAGIKDNPESVNSFLALLNLINPVAGIAGAALISTFLSLFGAYKKWKQPLVQSTSTVQKLLNGLYAAGEVIEKVVKPNEEVWETVKGKLKAAEENGAIMPDKMVVSSKNGVLEVYNKKDG